MIFSCQLITGDIPLTVNTLEKLQICVQENVPWENLDTMTGKKFDLK